ncbi:MAG TPA: methyltransferase domain-containing protein [Syntrophorhabdales bacterium]|nr:methyltransferase domain-containing protein [Syntrophorhabdales bacterium]
MPRCKCLLFVLALLCALIISPLHHAIAQEAKSQPAQAQPSDEVVWQRFVEWVSSAPPADATMTLFNQYRARLVSAGTSGAEADRQLSVIRRMNNERSDGWRIMFNNIYASSTPGFVTEPNALLVAMVEGRTPGRALDVGMGQGRNTVFLALKGWDVTGFDVSEEGLAVARKNAERAGVKITAIRETDEAFDYGSDRWDLIAVMYETLPVTSAAYVERVRKSLKSGGLIVIESYGADASQFGRTAAAIDPSQLLAAFKDFRLLHFEDIVTRGDWAPPQTKTRIVRMVAEKRP